MIKPCFIYKISFVITEIDEINDYNDWLKKCFDYK